MTNKWDARIEQIEQKNAARQREIEETERLQRAIMMGIVAAMLFAVVLVIWAAIQ